MRVVFTTTAANTDSPIATLLAKKITKSEVTKLVSDTLTSTGANVGTIRLTKRSATNLVGEICSLLENKYTNSNATVADLELDMAGVSVSSFLQTALVEYLTSMRTTVSAFLRDMHVQVKLDGATVDFADVGE